MEHKIPEDPFSKQNMLQAAVDKLCQHWQQERSESQMTLGQLIERLQELPSDLMLTNAGMVPMSYRGYYTDLSFEPDENVTVQMFLDSARGSMGKVFQGYKGGDYLMGENTPVWIANYAC